MSSEIHLSAPISLLILGVILALGAAALTFAPKLPDALLLRPYEFARGRRRWTFITGAFVHADFAHLLFNSMSLWFFGPGLERAIGSLRFAALYAVGLLLSQVGTQRKHRDNPGYATLGASGAIAAVLFASIVYRPTERLFIFPVPFPIPAPLFGLGYLAYSAWSARQQRGQINHDAHLGGALTGLLFVAPTDPQAYPRALALLAR